jgi:hypothetical protein
VYDVYQYVAFASGYCVLFTLRVTPCDQKQLDSACCFVEVEVEVEVEADVSDEFDVDDDVAAPCADVPPEDVADWGPGWPAPSDVHAAATSESTTSTARNTPCLIACIAPCRAGLAFERVSRGRLMATNVGRLDELGKDCFGNEVNR